MPIVNLDFDGEESTYLIDNAAVNTLEWTTSCVYAQNNQSCSESPLYLNESLVLSSNSSVFGPYSPEVSGGFNTTGKKIRQNVTVPYVENVATS